MSDETNILGSFGLQDTLNPKIWENADSAKDSRMKPKVREALMKIAEKFQGDLSEEIDRETLRSKANSWKQKIETLISDIKKNGLEKSETKLKTFKDKLKEYRTAGLEKGGEFSYENLVFKYLRRSGLIEKLYDTVNKQSDKELSVEVRKID